MILETGNQLLLDILYNPKEDDLRLIYADWLDEVGEHDRAEFIRVHVELSQLDPYHLSCTGGKCPVCSKLRFRLEDVWNPPGHGFVQPVEDSRHPALWWRWRLKDSGRDEIGPWGLVTRGFVSKVECTCDEFMKVAEKLFTTHPIEGVVLTDKEEWKGEPHDDFQWYNGDRPHPTGIHQESDLPQKLYLLLEQYFDEQHNAKGYHTREEARTALSRACVRYGRTFLPKINGA